MQPPRYRMEFGQLSSAHASSLHGLDPALPAYTSFRQATHLSYRTEYGLEMQAVADMMPKWEQYVLCELPTNVLRTFNDPQSFLELAVRQRSASVGPCPG